MKVSMQLTLDGLVRAMRMKAHEVAEAVESGRAYDETAGLHGKKRPMVKPHSRGGEHERGHP